MSQDAGSESDSSSKISEVSSSSLPTPSSCTIRDVNPVEAMKQVEHVPELTPYSVFTNKQKWIIVFMISLSGLFSPLSANIYFPAIPSITLDLNTSTERINLSVTVYMIFQAVSPAFWAAICDVMGRRPVFIGTFTVYIGACVGLFFTHSYGVLMFLRCLQAFGSASLIAASAGVVADIANPSERGGFMGANGIGAMLGPCIGPLIGGLITDAYFWQAIFALLACWATIPFLLIILFLPETLRSLVGNGRFKPNSWISKPFFPVLLPIGTENQQSGSDTGLKAKSWRDIDPLAPLKPFLEMDILLVLIANALCYGLFYSVTTSTSTLFKEVYQLTESQIGLCFLAFGGGCVISSALNGIRLNKDFRIISLAYLNAQGEQADGVLELSAVEIKQKISAMSGGLADFPVEKARLRSIPYFIGGLLVSTIVYGWTVRAHVHLAVPLICQFVIGITSTSISNCTSTLLLDLNPAQSASVTAANNLARCSFGAASTAIIDIILQRMGSGWTYTMLSLITLAFTPLLLLEWIYGIKIRKKRLARQPKEDPRRKRASEK